MKKKLSLNDYRKFRFTFAAIFIISSALGNYFKKYVGLGKFGISSFGIIMSISFIMAVAITVIMNRKVRKKELILDEMAQKNQDDAWYLATVVLFILFNCAYAYTFLEQKPIIMYYDSFTIILHVLFLVNDGAYLLLEYSN